jgi:hypothetical protein
MVPPSKAAQGVIRTDKNVTNILLFQNLPVYFLLFQVLPVTFFISKITVTNYCRQELHLGWL